MAEAKSFKAKYIGDPRNPGEPLPDVLDAYETTFENGKFAEVDGKFAEKVAGNDHFEVQGAKKADPDKETAESTAEFSARVASISDRDGLEEMLKAEKRPMAKAVLERRIETLPAA